MTEEEWKPVVGFEGRYEISNCGRLRSVSRTMEKHLKPTAKRKGAIQHAQIKGRLLKTQIDAYGYACVGLRGSDGNERRAKIC